ncbi:5-hydroxytryptamine receptor 3A-like [Scophthalmus maximus]|uniref:5-hydroxytryptamine receptor 3A-like n=1 Tax=Scophthalmus maximus TaxID=52904 RepID=UPI001FA88CE5|nr:5-hydroxytryptamine receptor 3A-like [Scophthalmus maximus]
MLAGFVLLLVLTAVDGEKVCSHQDVLNHLNLTRHNELYSLTRPVLDFRQPTNVTLDILLYAILEVVKNDQTFVPYFWKFMRWDNQYISWNQSDFCGIEKIYVPTEMLWKPDFTIEEMIAKDRAPPSPLLTIFSNGTVLVQNDQVLIITCRMHVHKFPFDTQSCNISFKSFIHSVEEMKVFCSTSSKEVTKESRELMRTQYEWLFQNMTVTSKIVNTFGFDQDLIIFTIYMKRRSILYIVNFLLPILFFLCLDLASFLISDGGGEKLSFKVTVLLAITVLQLILNDILPSSSNRIPLIAVYCIGVFTLMLLSLLETILVMYLIRRDLAPQDSETDEGRSPREDKQGRNNFHQCGGEEKTWNDSVCVWDVFADETPAERLQTSGSQLTEESQGLEKLSEDLRVAVKTLRLLLNSRTEDGKPGYWARKTKIINKCFFVCYAVAASLFLLLLFLNWN